MIRSFARVAVSALLIGSFAGCGSMTLTPYTPDPEAVTHMPADKARAFLARASGGSLCFSAIICGDFNATLAGIELSADQTLIFVERDGDRSHTLPLQALKMRVEIMQGSGWVYFTDGSALYLATTAKQAQAIADALVAIQMAPIVEKQQQAAFEAVAQSYRDAKVKPEPSEDVRRFKVQALAAVRDKQFADAANYYDQGLQIAPWWPEGHFNRALVLAEINRYPEALKEMHRYLILVPDASDARDAQDLIYQWETKVPH